MEKINVKKMREEFLNYANGEDFPDGLFRWQNYDGGTKQVFIWADGEWNNDVRIKLETFLKTNFHKRMTISRMINTYMEKE